jgi:hypothetical protein
MSAHREKCDEGFKDRAGGVVQEIGGVILRTDGTAVTVVRVEPAPFGLLSDAERERRIAAVHEALQGLPGPAQIVVTSRPIDLDAYLLDLERRLAEAEGARRSLLRGYLGYVRGLAAGGEATERRFHVLLVGADGRADGEAVLQRASEFAAALGRADLAAHVCDDREGTDLLFAFLHPGRGGSESADEPAPAPRYVPFREGTGHADH